MRSFGQKLLVLCLGPYVAFMSCGKNSLMACCLLPTDSSSGPPVGDRVGPKYLFSGSGDNCEQLGARPSGMNR